MNRQVIILAVAARPLYWLILAASVWVLLRGHNEPGGGFIAGLLAVSASILWAVAHDSKAARQRLPLGDPLRLATFGVLLAGLSGLPGVWVEGSYLTHLWASVPLGFATLKVSTVMLFDLGVYLSVWGALSGYALALLALDQDLDAREGDV